MINGKVTRTSHSDHSPRFRPRNGSSHRHGDTVRHSRRLWLLQKCAVYAAAEVLLEPHDADAAESILIRKWNEAAVVPSFDRHFWHDRHAGTCRHHRQNGGELAAFENHIGLQTRPPACGQDGREVEQSDSLVYFPEDRAADFVLLCAGKPRSPLRLRTRLKFSSRP